MKQTDLWSEKENKFQPDQDPEQERIDELNQQNRNLRLLSPIYRIEQSKGKVTGQREKPLSMETIDTVYLSILTLEYYAAYALSRESIPSQEVISYLQSKVELMDSQLSLEDSIWIAAWVHDSLCNQLENYKAFNFSYFDPVKQTMNLFNFRLINIESVSVQDGNKCKITEEGVTALLTYINADPKLQDEVTALLTQRLIKTGRYEDALQMAERSRKRVIQYQESISAAADKARREAKAGSLSKTVLPLMAKSSHHVSERIKEEDETSRNLREITISKLDNKTIILVHKLRSTIDGNLRAYQGLFDHIDKIHAGFEHTIKSFLRPSKGVIPNMVNDLLEPTCHWRIETLSDHADNLVNLIMPAKLPAVFDVITVLDKLDIGGDKEQHNEAEEQDAEMEAITRIKPVFTEEMIDQCQLYYRKILAEQKKISLQKILSEAEQDRFSESFQHCLAYLVIMSFSDNQSAQNKASGLQISKLGRFQHHFIIGDDLLIQKTETKVCRSEAR